MDGLRDKAETLHALHQPGRPLALANAWDVISARLVEAAGAQAVATTSAALAWSLGWADGNHADRDRVLEVVARIVAAVTVPVSADIESGYGETAADVATTVRGVLDAGAVGVNIEDVHPHDPAALRSATEQADRIAAARRVADAAGVPLYVNARVDTYLRSIGDPESRLGETIERARAYLDAGASGIFVPGVVDSTVIAELVAGLGAHVRLNVLAGPGAPAVGELARLGVARVSLGSAVAGAAYAVVRRGAVELLGPGTYTSVSDAIDYSELNALVV